MDGGWPFVGRSREVRRLHELLTTRRATVEDGTDAGGCPLHVLSGPSGIGKTRLLSEVIAAAASAGTETELVLASASTSSIPYGAVSHLLPPRRTSSPAPEPGVSDAADGLMLRHLMGALLTRSRRGVVLGVDDAHLLDGASATLVQRLSLSPRVAVLLTIRDGQSCPAAIAEMVDSDRARRLRLGPLDRRLTERVAATALGGPVDIRLAVELWNVSRGNPLVLREAIHAYRDRGALELGRDGWQIVAGERGVVRPAMVGNGGASLLMGGIGVPAAVSSRIASLADDERIAMEAVALGEPLEVDFVLSLTSLSSVERLERSGLLLAPADSTDPGRREAFRLAHPLFGEALRQQMAVTTRRRLAGRLVELIAERGARRRGDVLRQASWLLSAGSRDRPDVLLAAASRATALGDPASGERFSRAAHARGGGAAALLAVGESLQTQGRAADAERWLHNASVAAGLTGDGRGPPTDVAAPDVQTTTRIAAVRAMNLQWGLGQVEAAHNVLADAEQRLSDTTARAWLAAIRAASLVFLERFAEALDVATSVMEREGVGLPARVLAECPAQIVWTVSCRYARVVASADRLTPLLDEVRDAVPLVTVMVNSIRLFAFIGLGRIAEAVDGCRAHSTSALERGALTYAGYWQFQLGRTLLIAGRLHEAREALAEATQLLDHGSLFGHDASAYAGLAQATALMGDAAAARAALSRADRRSDARNGAWRGVVTIARCWLRVAEEDVDEARRLAAATAAAEGANGNVEREAEALDLLARLGRPDQAAGRLATIAAGSDGPMLPAMAASADGACRGDVDALIAAGADLHRQGLLLHAADAYAVAAVTLHRGEQLGRCAAIARKARQLYRDSGGARTYAACQLDAVDPAAALSPREAQVCRLAAQAGTTNASVAARLGVAERTVANHLGRAYRKLGISGRSELSAVLSVSSDV